MFKVHYEHSGVDGNLNPQPPQCKCGARPIRASTPVIFV